MKKFCFKIGEGLMGSHKAEVYAIWKYGCTYEGTESHKKIWDGLTPEQKMACRMAVNDIMAAPDEDDNIPGGVISRKKTV